jgi:hypothetical protein
MVSVNHSVMSITSSGPARRNYCSYWLPPNWTWKLDYLYIDPGSLDATTSFSFVVDPGVFYGERDSHHR